jgi:hypothetical protein
LARLASLKDECFARYEAAATGLGLDPLVLRSETVLVVGEVARPGVYPFGSVKQRGSKLTFADRLSAAGVSQRVQSVEYHGRKCTGVIPAANTLGPMDIPADTIILARVDAPDPSFYTDSIILFDNEGEWRPLANLFSPEAQATVERLRAQDWRQWPHGTGPVATAPAAGEGQFFNRS